MDDEIALPRDIAEAKRQLVRDNPFLSEDLEDLRVVGGRPRRLLADDLRAEVDADLDCNLEPVFGRGSL